jgi:hypothetical protein
MYLEIDPNQINDSEAQKDCKKAIAYLADHEEIILKAASAYLSLESKIEFLAEIKRSRERDLLHFPIKFRNAGMEPTGHLTDEIGINRRTLLTKGEGKWICKISIAWLAKIIREMSEEKEPEPSELEAQSLPSTPYQVLLIHYLLKALNLELDGKQKEKLIAAITGKNSKNIYDAVLKPLETKKGKRRLKEMNEARQLFDSIGLGEISTLITKDLR